MKWIRISVLILCACLVATASGQQSTGNVRNNWSEFHRPEMQRYNPYEVTLNVQNVPSLQLKWSYATGNSVVSSPTVAKGVVYVGSVDGNVYALSATTGAKLWSYATGSYVESSPAVANGVVYVGSGNKNVYAFSLAAPEQK